MKAVFLAFQVERHIQLVKYWRGTFTANWKGYNITVIATVIPREMSRVKRSWRNMHRAAIGSGSSKMRRMGQPAGPVRKRNRNNKKVTSAQLKQVI